MRTETAKETRFSAAFAKAGLRLEDVEFDRAIALYLNKGGTIERAHARIDLAAEKLPGGPAEGARNGLMNSAVRQPELSEEGLGRRANNGQFQPADLGQPQADGRANDGLPNGLSVDAPPIREPSANQISAATKAREDAAKSVFDRELTRTGQMWGNVHYCELDAMVQDSEVAAEVRHTLGTLTKEKRLKMLRELMTPYQFSRILGKLRTAGKIWDGSR